MRVIVLTAAAMGLFVTIASAQNMPAQQGPQNPAVKDMHQNNSSMPVAGANSFTEAEAKSQIEAKGYTHVARLRKDAQGVWRGER